VQASDVADSKEPLAVLLGAPVTTRTAAAGAAPVKPTVLQLQPVAEAAQELSVASEDDDKGTPFTINLVLHIFELRLWRSCDSLGT